ncbi:alanine racemase [Desulforhabdus amnigena]|uniref:Alanine racemase n=1 Tax=Desulforhabdus amnigena TaxID=40218 RepID=A0A9W6FU05_9BACT|nr:alanine racemase [Desulforhabdus amnigena]NLJ29265.1 alanine racemase [Deltaproteobacteria bacterium]GLI34856.1 alanine racemase [Desulforhabdus amnigena]
MDHHRSSHLTQAFIHLDHLTHNMNLLQSLVGDRPLWPAIKANAYGHGAEIVGRHLMDMGYETLCVAHVSEAIDLKEAGLNATFIVLSATLPENSEYLVAYGCEPVVCTLEMVEGIARVASRTGKKVAVHLKVDTGMGRVGIRPDQVVEFLDRCRDYPEVTVKGIMSHFPMADEEDKSFAVRQIDLFRQVKEASRGYGISVYHFANSAAIFDLPDAYFDAARPGISIYGLKPSLSMLNPRVKELKPVLEWKSRITFLKEVPAGTGLSYGHTFHTQTPSLIATIPLGYGDGMSRLLSNKLQFLIHGIRCPQVGRICMDQCLVDVTALRGRVEPGNEAVIVGKQGNDEITVDDLAQTLGTINYEIVTNIAKRVPRIPLKA